MRTALILAIAVLSFSAFAGPAAALDPTSTLTDGPSSSACPECVCPLDKLDDVYEFLNECLRIGIA